MNHIVTNQEVQVTAWVRLLNCVIDLIAIIMLLACLGLVFGLLTYMDIYGPAEWLNGLGEGGSRLLGIASLFGYYAITESVSQKTLGKLITGTIVVNEDGEKPALSAILGRSLCRVFSLEALSFLRAYPRGWHDSASNTYVVNAKKFKELSDVQDSFDEIGTGIPAVNVADEAAY